jgi:hypothetical protein
MNSMKLFLFGTSQKLLSPRHEIFKFFCDGFNLERIMIPTETFLAARHKSATMQPFHSHNKGGAHENRTPHAFRHCRYGHDATGKRCTSGHEIAMD